MRTDEEILLQIEKAKEYDPFELTLIDLISRLSFKAAKKFLKPEVTETEWEVQPKDRDFILKEMFDYMPFAWEKANNCRGISAGRSMAHYMNWIWLIGDNLGNLSEYEFYGRDNLIKICKHYGWDYTQWDDN